VSLFALSGITNYPLDLPEIALKNEDPNDYHYILWQPLLARGDKNLSKLSFFKLEKRFKDLEIQIRRQ
jgi:hypothetical protein